jgi:hypothetical protein
MNEEKERARHTYDFNGEVALLLEVVDDAAVLTQRLHEIADGSLLEPVDAGQDRRDLFRGA